MKKSIAVLGLGKYGMSLVRALNEMGMDVLAVDREESIVREIADYCTEAVCAELSDAIMPTHCPEAAASSARRLMCSVTSRSPPSTMNRGALGA